MRILTDTSERLAFRESGFFAAIVGIAALIFAGYLAFASFGSSAGVPWSAVGLVTLLGVIFLIFAGRTDIAFDRKTGTFRSEKYWALGMKHDVNEFPISQIAAVSLDSETVQASPTQTAGRYRGSLRGRYSVRYSISLRLTNGGRLTLGNISSSNKSSAAALGAKIATFLGVSLEEALPPSPRDTVLAMKEAGKEIAKTIKELRDINQSPRS